MNTYPDTPRGAVLGAADLSSAAPKWVGRADSAIKWASEVPAAILLVVEVVALLANVIWRYLLNAPLTWGEEFASLCFLWLAMFGAVIALRRGEHMRLTTFIARYPRKTREFLETFGDVLVMAFLLALIAPALEYIHEEWAITTPALEIRHSYRVAAIAVGVVLMLAISALRLLSRRMSNVLISTAVVACVVTCGYAAQSIFAVLGNGNLLLFFLFGVSFMVVIGVPIMVAFGLSTLAYLLCVTTTPLMIVVSRIDEGMSGLILLSVPLFVLLGALIEAMGMAAAMIRFLASLIGHVKGGLSYVLIGAMYLVSGISGSKAADMAAVAPALFPEMKKRGEDEGELAAMLSSSGAMSETIPPSLVLITIGSVTGVSIAALFSAGLMPAVIGAMAMSAVVWFRNRRKMGTGAKAAPLREVGQALLVAIPAITLPVVIRMTVVGGVATATEVATIGVAYTFAVGLIVYRVFDWRRLYPILIDTASLSGAILIIIGCATAMAWALTQSGFSNQLAQLMSMVPGGQLGFLAVSALAFIVLGSFLEGIPAIVLFGPLLFPVARAAGVNEIHYSMVVVFAMGLGLFAPPFGVGFYAACAIGKVDPDIAAKRVWPYLGALFVSLILIVTIPWISLG